MKARSSPGQETEHNGCVNEVKLLATAVAIFLSQPIVTVVVAREQTQHGFAAMPIWDPARLRLEGAGGVHCVLLQSCLGTRLRCRQQANCASASQRITLAFATSYRNPAA